MFRYPLYVKVFLWQLKFAIIVKLMTHYPHFLTIRFEKGFLLIVCYDESQKRISRLGSFICYVHKFFRKASMFYPLIRTRTYACQGVRNGSSENFAYALNE